MKWNSETEKLCPNKNLQRTEQILEHPIINEYSGFHINHIQRKTDSSSHGIKGKKQLVEEWNNPLVSFLGVVFHCRIAV